MASRRRTHLSELSPARARLSHKHTTRKEFGERLYKLILEREMNQSEFARQVGIERDSVSRYVRGVNLPDVLNLKKMAEFLKIEPGELLPNFDLSAIDDADDDPVLEMRVIESDPTRAMLIIRREMPTSMAVEVMRIITPEIESTGPKKRSK